MPPTVVQAAPAPALGPTGEPQPEESIWSTILRGLGSSKAVLSKRLLVVGDPNSGKSVLVQHLRRDHREILSPPTAGSASAGTQTAAAATAALGRPEQSELALSYTYADVKDEEDTVARLGVYQLAASHPALLPFALNAASLPDTAILIVLDWQRPWAFIDSLERWFRVIAQGLEEIRTEGQEGQTGWSRGQVTVDEAKERLERFLQMYAEPSPDGAAAPAATATANPTTTTTTTSGPEDILLPLPEGSLSHNLGIPIVVVCSKADAMATLEKEQDYKEEQFDHIQQTLRTICLKYGASLFYTSTHRPRSFALLRAYLLHRLIGPGSAAAAPSAIAPGHTIMATPGSEDPTDPSAPQASASASALQAHATEASKPTSLLFKYPYRAQVVDRETISVPSGWDTWGKVAILREGFECRTTSEGWDTDMAILAQGKAPSMGGADGEEEEGLRKPYERTIRDSSVGVKPNAMREEVVAESEQDFLARQMEVLKRARAATLEAGASASAAGSGYGTGTGASAATPSPHQPHIPPMASALGTTTPSTLMGSVGGGDILHGYGGSAMGDAAAHAYDDDARLGSREDALLHAARDITGSVPYASDLSAGPHHDHASLPPPPSSLSSTASPASSLLPPAGSAAGASGSGAGSTSQNEVLANFFQSLLAKKTSTASTPGEDAAARSQVAEELDRMKQGAE